ncbi:hypothetical protein D3C71_1924980 [compost metagenome]
MPLIVPRMVAAVLCARATGAAIARQLASAQASRLRPVSKRKPDLGRCGVCGLV